MLATDLEVFAFQIATDGRGASTRMDRDKHTKEGVVLSNGSIHDGMTTLLY